MPKASSCKHGPVHFFLLRFFKSYCYLCKSLFLGFPCSQKPVEMAGAGCGVTPMSRLSQHSSRRLHRSPHTGKHLDSTSPSIASKKKPPKRKTLSSRYTTDFPSKRRKLGLNAIRDPVILSNEAHEAHHAAVSPKTCHTTEVNHEERETKPLSSKGRAHKAKAKARAKTRAKAKGIQRDLKVEASSRAKLFDSKVNFKVENHATAAVGIDDVKAKLPTLNETTRAGSIPKGNHNGDLIPSSIEKVNLKSSLLTSESNEAGPLLLDKNDPSSGDLPKHAIDRQAQVSNRGLERKSSSEHFPICQTSGFELGTPRDHEAVQPSKEHFASSPSPLSESLIRDSLDVSPFSKQDSSLLEGRFLRPRRQVKKKSKSEDHRLPPWDYVGKRVVVYWPHAKAWYAGTVIKYDDSSKKHKIKYDDSDEECISFRRHKVLLERSPSSQSADGLIPGKGQEVPSAQTIHHSAGKKVAANVGLYKSVQLQGDFVEKKCIVEDNTLLSVFAPRHRVREGSRELLCNGSGKRASAVRRVDITPGKGLTVQKANKNNMSSVAQENTGKADVDDKGNASGGKAAFVYVRRTKGRQKVDVLSAALAPGERVNDSGLSGALHQERSRKRKKCQPLLQQTARVDSSHGLFSDTNFNSSAANDVCDKRGGDGSASERTARKRNKRSLKKLVSQASVMQGAGAMQELGRHHDQVRNRTAKRTGRKFVRKHKLTNLDFSAGDRRLPTKRVPCLVDDVEGLACDATLCHDVVQLHDSEVSADKLLVHESHTSFDFTIHLVLPVVTPDLFTLQLFSILTRVKFCEGGSFDERFSLNGSLEDWMCIFRIVLGIIKAIPLKTWINGKQWQRRILHELWNVMPRCGPALTDALAFLPAKAEGIVAEHFRGANVSCMMASRQILNLFVCYFVKPYIVATVCEKGASLKEVVQQFLLLDRSRDGGITCLRQSLRSIPLQASSGSADLNFSSYLMLFPRPEDWCTEDCVFLKQMEELNATAGCAEKWVPHLTIKKSNYLGWQVTSAHLLDRGYAIDESERKVFKLEQGSAKRGFLNQHCSRHAELRNTALDQKYGWLIGFHNCNCLNSALLFTSFLQRSLYEAVGRGFVTSGASSRPLTLLSKVPAIDEQKIPFDRTKLIGVKEESGLGSVVVPSGDATTIHVKIEPDLIMSRRNSSITTESNGAAIKEESSVEMYGRQQTLGGFSSKPDLVGQLSIGIPLKTDEQHFSGQIDQEYYVHSRSKDIKKVKKSRPRHRSERQRVVHKELPAYCCADLLYMSGDKVLRAHDARVELQMNAEDHFLVAAHLDGRGYVQKVIQGSSLAENPAELRWKSGNGWALDFPDREQWNLFRCIYNDLCGQSFGGAGAKEIPTPGVMMMEDSHAIVVSGSSVRPFFAIKYPDDELEVAYKTGRVLYDLDSEDEDWMVKTNRISRDNEGDNGPAISDDTLEQMLDRLEKEVHRTGEKFVAVHDAINFCQDLGGPDIVRAVHAYWSNKRVVKGKALLRYFQPPLWEQYQEKLRFWETRMENCPPNAQNILLERFPRPVMSAFCLQSRSLDVLDTGKKMLRQRSQRKIKPPSRFSSEDLYMSGYHYADSAWHPSYRTEQAKPSTHVAIRLLGHATRNHFHNQEDQELPESAKAAKERAVEARRLAEIRATKLQRRFLEFDLSLQRAWALLIEYESVTGGEASARGEAFEERMSLLFRQCSSLLSKGDDSSEDEPPSKLGRVCKEVSEEFLEAFARKCSLNEKAVLCKVDDKTGEFQLGGHDIVEEASPLLPISVKGSSYAWNGSSLL